MIIYTHLLRKTASIIVTSPNGSESFAIGTTQNISWTSTGVDSVKIDYSTDGGSNWTTIIASTPAIVGSYAWVVPSVSSTNCKVRVSDASDSSVNDISNAVFSIVQPIITVTSPDGGESWRTGNSQSTNQGITWTSIGVTNVKLEYTTDNETNWTTIVDSIAASTGSYSWLVPIRPSVNCKVRVSDASNSSVNDVSNAAFTITETTGNTILSMAMRDGDWEIYVMNPDGTNQTRLTNYTNHDMQAAWSPNGSKILFSSYRDGTGGDIYTMNADGSNVTRLTSIQQATGDPSWSPDSTKIVFRGGLYQIYVMNADGTNQTRLTNDYPVVYGWPMFSPDGSKIIYTKGTTGDENSVEIYMMNENGTNQTNMTNNSALDGRPMWSPDGSKIAFYSTRDGQEEIYIMNKDGSNQTRLTNNSAADYAPSWSPDGTQIAFNSDRNGNDEIYIMNTDGTNQTRITNNPSSDVMPYWARPVYHVMTNIVTLTAPNSGESWAAGTTQNITWTSTGVDSVKIEYTTNGGTNWATIIVSTPASAESYAWTVPSVSSASCKVRVSDVSSSSVNDISNTVFSIIQNSGLADSAWPMFGQNPQHTGRGTSSYSASNILKWRYQAGNYIQSSPAIGAGETLYFGSNDNYIYAINSDGTLKWKYLTGGYIWSSPAIGTDETVYIGSGDNYLYAINSDGTLKWKYYSGGGITSSPAIGIDGTVYIGDHDKYIYAIKSDGTLKWKYRTDAPIGTSPAIGDDGTVYIGGGSGVINDNYLYAINSDGTLKWKYQTGDNITSSPTIGTDGTVYVGSNDNYLYAINSDGTLKWKYLIDAVVYFPAIGTDGTLYLGANSPYLYAINSDGTLKWKYTIGDPVRTLPAIGMDGTIYVGSYYFYAINSDGTLKWRYQAGDSFGGSPAIGTDGAVYIGAYDNYLYAFAPENQVTTTINTSAPNGGESWTAGTTKNITWTSTGVDSVKIEYSTDNGMNWIKIIASTPAAVGTFTWTVPGVSSSACKVRISDVANALVNDVSNAVFSIVLPTTPTITVTSPNGSESWAAGSMHDITWTSSTVSNVRIDYSKDSGANWTNITTSVPAATGSFTWELPVVNSENCLVKITDAANSSIFDISNAPFSIVPSKSVRVVSPNGGENWDITSVHGITWTSTGIDYVKIEYSTDSGQNWSAIVASTDGSAGTYSWTVPAPVSVNTLVRISEAGITSGSAVSDTSDGVFIILPDPTNRNALFEIDTELGTAGYQTSDPLMNIGPDEAVGFGIYAGQWVTSKSFEISMLWNSTKGTFQKNDSYISTNGESISINGANITLPVERNILSETAGAVELVASSNLPGIFTATVNRTITGVSLLDNGLLMLPVFKTSSTFGNGDSLSVKVDITVKDRLGNQKTLPRKYFTVFGKTPSAPALTLLSPNGAEEMIRGGAATIRWSAQDVDNIDIEYSYDGGSNWESIATGVLASLGSYSWNISGTLAESHNCVMRIKNTADSSVKDVSDAPFSVLSGDYVTVNSPKDGDVWTINSNKEIRWSYSGVSEVSIELSRNDGADYNETIADNQPALNGIYIWKVTGPSSDECRVRIKDSSNDETYGESGKFSVIQSTINITPTIIKSYPGSGDLVFRASVTGTSAIDSIYVVYCNSSSSLFNKTCVMKKGSGNEYTYSLTEGSILAPGLNYYFVAKDDAGMEARSPADVGFYSLIVDVGVLTSGSYNISGGSSQNSYRMISIPLRLEQNTITSQISDLWEIGTYGVDWRLFRFPQGGTSYQEYPNIDGFEPGKAFWIISKNLFTIKAPKGTTVSTSSDSLFKITLQPGWNDIADPWMFDIPWNIKNPSGSTLDIYTYNGGWSNPMITVSKLEPWKGYAVYCHSQTEIYIWLSPYDATAAGKKEVVSAENLPDWILSLGVSAGNASDSYNYLGISDDAEKEWDSFDHMEPYPVGDYVSLYFPHPEWKFDPGNYATDFKPFTDESFCWDFDVKTNIKDEVIKVSLKDEGNVPAGFGMEITDIDTGSPVQIYSGYFTFNSDLGVTEKHYRLTLSSDGSGGDDHSAVIPEKFIKSVCYPNPFNPGTSIRYELSEPGYVRINIFNAVGQLVISSEPGYEGAGVHEFAFRPDGLTSGVYIYRIETGNSRAFGKMLYMK